MSISDQSPSKPHWPSLLRLHLGMTMLGAGAGLSYPFAANLLAGAGAQSLSVIVLLCTVPLTGAGILLAASSRQGLKGTRLDLFLNH